MSSFSAEFKQNLPLMGYFFALQPASAFCDPEGLGTFLSFFESHVFLAEIIGQDRDFLFTDKSYTLRIALTNEILKSLGYRWNLYLLLKTRTPTAYTHQLIVLDMPCEADDYPPEATGYADGLLWLVPREICEKHLNPKSDWGKHLLEQTIAQYYAR